jgi:hypothetical protein
MLMNFAMSDFVGFMTTILFLSKTSSPAQLDLTEKYSKRKNRAKSGRLFSEA